MGLYQLQRSLNEIMTVNGEVEKTGEGIISDLHSLTATKEISVYFSAPYKI
jgi:hypothetical protein